MPGQTWTLDQPLAHMAVPFQCQAAQVPAVGHRQQQRANQQRGSLLRTYIPLVNGYLTTI